MLISGMQRRRFLQLSSAAAGGLLVAGTGLATACQRQSALPTGTTKRAARLGFLALTSAADYAPYIASFRNGLANLGYVSGDNLVVEERFAEGREELLPALAADLVQSQLDLLVTASTQASLAALQATRTIPIVFTNSGDPLGAGLVNSLARPAGNATGLTSLNRELAGKRLELLKTAVPSISRVAVLWADAAEGDLNETRKAAFWLGLQVTDHRVTSPGQIDAALQAVLESEAQAIVAISTPLVNSFSARVAAFAREHHLPTISEQSDFVGAGGLLAYGADVVRLFQRAAVYVDKILSGARPTDLPVERAQRFELALNLRTAQTLNLVLPQALLLQATEVVS